MKIKLKIILILAAATASCFGLSVYFAGKANLNSYQFPYPLNVGNQYLAKKPKLEVTETKKAIPVTEAIQSLEIEGVQADVQLIPSQLPQIEVSLKAGVDRSLVVSQDNARVKLNVEGKHENHPFSLFTPYSPSATLEVKIPKTVQNLKIVFISGNIRGEGLQLKNLSVKNTSGDIKFTNAKVENADLHSISGWIGLDGSFAHLMGDLISGSFRVYLSDTIPQVALHTVSGEITVRIPEKADASVSASFLSGKFMIKNQGKKKLAGRGEIVFGKGTGSIKLTTTSGNMTIE